MTIKTIRTTITDESLVNDIEQHMIEHNLTEQELIHEALNDYTTKEKTKKS